MTLQLKRNIIILYSFLLPIFINAQNKDKALVEIEDSIFQMLKSAKDYINNGDFIRGDELINITSNYFNEFKNNRKEKNFFHIEFEIQNASAWNKTLLKQYPLAETLYTKLIESTPDSCHLLLSTAYTGISSLYGMQKGYELSEKYALLALEEAKSIQDDEAAFHAQSNLGDIYMETGQYEKALEKYLEVRRLSVVIKKNESISLGNLALAYLKLNKKGLAEQYFTESLSLSKDSNPVVYSIILPTYCQFLIDNGKKEKATELILEVADDSRYTQMNEYNLQYLHLLHNLFPKSNISFMLLSIITLLILTIIFILILLIHKRKQLIRVNNQLSEIPKRENNSLSDLTYSKENTLQLICLFESFPHIQKSISKIKNNIDNKSAILDELKELDIIFSPFVSDKMEKEISYYIEQDNHEFYDKLKKHHPKLNLTDLRLSTLIKMGMSTKEIATLTNKSVRGIESAKFRLRKKMNLDTAKDIYDYFLEIEKLHS